MKNKLSFLFFAGLIFFCDRLYAATYTVTSVANSGIGTLAQAIIDANNNTGVADVINFNLGSSGGPFTILLTSSLPSLTDNAGVTIDGWTNAGNNGTPNIIPAFNTKPASPLNPVYKVILSNSNGTIANGLTISSNNNIIKGLVLPNFTTNAILISSGTNNLVTGCYISMDAAGTIRGGTVNGITINSSNNTIGDGTAAGANLISGSSNYGIVISAASTNLVAGNIIGLQKDGTTVVGGGASQQRGVYITGSSTGNMIGNTTAGGGNVISGNQGAGIAIDGASGPGAFCDIIKGNRIGPAADGLTNVTTATPQQNGIDMEYSTTIGHSIEGNIISNNDDYGIWCEGDFGTIIKGNYIGVGANGDLIPGTIQNAGIAPCYGGSIIGGSLAGEGNVISGNIVGIILMWSSSTNTIIKNNIIGPKANGSGFITANPQDIGISFNSGSGGVFGVIIGGSNSNDRNVISGNNIDGITLSNTSYGNYIQGNSIGTDLTGTINLGNGRDGIHIDDANSGSNVIGGTGAGEGNSIAYNAGDGIDINSSSSDFNPIRRNSIYCNGGKGINLNIGTTDGNDAYSTPVVLGANVSGANGTAPANATVEIFYNHACSGNCGGKAYLATVTANGSGTWSYAGALTAGSAIVVTATSATNNTSEFSNCTCMVLPIELLEFTVEPMDDQHVLAKWTTTIEVNNDYFTVFRSSDCISWEQVGIVKGAGTSSTEHYYTFIVDINKSSNDPITQSPILYYRLKQTDYNGDFAYYGPLPVRLNGMDIISIYPTPATDHISYSVISSMQSAVTLTVTDVLGRKVIHHPEEIHIGENKFSLTLEGISEGYYVLSLVGSNGNRRIQKQFMVK